MKNNNKLVRILEGAILVALGIIIAICGIGSAIDLYFGIIFTVAGACLLILACTGLSKKDTTAVNDLVFGSVVLTIGVCLFTPWLSFAALVEIFVIALLGLGIGLVLAGAYFVAKKALFTGIGQIVVGALMVTFVILYKTVPDFSKAFWIIIGILVAIYGALVIVGALINKKK